jgi:tetratricopeptide (TPR) repeat protein
MFSNMKRISISLLMIGACAGLVPASYAQTDRLALLQRSFAEPSDPARDLYNAGLKLYDDFRYDDAVKTFREVVAKYPKSNIADRAQYYVIRTLWQNRKPSEAIDQINVFQKSYPKSPWYPDVQEIRIQLTNQVPPAAIVRLRGPIPAAPQAPPAPPAPAPAPVPSPFVNISAENFSIPPGSFGSIFGGPQNSSDPQVSLMQEAMRAMFRSDVNRALEIAMSRLKADMADPVVLSTLDAVAQSASNQALPFLMDIVKNSPNMKARKDAIFWISQSRGNKDAAVDALTGLSNLPDDESESVTFALGQIHTDKAFNTLAAIARDKNKPEKQRTSALFWIGQSRVPNRVALLEDIYKTGGDSVNVRGQVLFALSQTHDPQVIPVLVNIATSDPDPGLRKQAIMWLGQTKSPEASKALEDILLPKK